MTDNQNQPGNVVSDYYDNYTETQKEILAIKIRKTKNVLFTIAAIIFASDLLGLLLADVMLLQTFLFILIIPAILTGLAFLASKEPLIAMIIATLIIVGIWVYTIIQVGANAAIMGWLLKIVVITLIIVGFQHAAEANKIRKELKF